MTTDPRTYIPKSSRPKLGRYTVNCPIAPLHRKPNIKSGLETQLLFGQYFDVYKLNKKWAWGQSLTPVKGSRQKGYVGYVPLKCFEQDVISPNYIVTGLRAPLFSDANIKSWIPRFLHLGARLKAKKVSARFLQLVSGEYAHVNHVRPLRKSPLTVDFVDIAERHKGLPYVWGGVSSDGLDCSGLVQSSLRAVGRDAPRDADMQQGQLGRHLPIRQSGLKRGDLIFWKGHVGIMTSAVNMVHANAFHMCVETEPLREAIKRIQASGENVTAIKRL